MFSGVTEEALITFLRPCEVARDFLDIHYLLQHNFWESLGKNWSNGQRWVKPSHHLIPFWNKLDSCKDWSQVKHLIMLQYKQDFKYQKKRVSAFILTTRLQVILDVEVPIINMNKHGDIAKISSALCLKMQNAHASTIPYGTKGDNTLVCYK